MTSKKVAEVAEGVIEKSSPDNLVFSENLVSSLTSSKNEPATVIVPKEFYWDQILFYLVSAILGLSFLDLSVEFFRGSIVQCYTPEYVMSRDHIAYFNNYCYGSLPNSQYYLIFILVSALLIIAPHYLWTSYFGAHFEFFFDLAKKLHRLRDTKTGEYNLYNFELVKKLEEKFSSSKPPWIFRWYKLKLFTQLAICAVILFINAIVFKDKDFKESFCCPKDTNDLNTTAWPIEEQISCIYNSLNLLYFLRNITFALVSLAVIAVIVGLVWCHVRHTTELGATEIAEFCHASCLPPEEHLFPSTSSIIHNMFYCQKGDRVSLREIMQFFSPRIENDLAFLVTRLFYADSGHGEVFKDIQIQKELKEITSKDHELLYLITRIHGDLHDKNVEESKARSKEAPHSSPVRHKKKWERLEDLKGYFFQSGFNDPNPEDFVYSFFEPYVGIKLRTRTQSSSLKDVLFKFLKFAPKNDLAFDVSFGNKSGHSLILARAFYEVATIHFNKFYQNLEETFKAEKYEAYRTFTFQADIYSQSSEKIWKSEQSVAKLFVDVKNRRYIDLIVIGPISDHSKVITANLLLEKLYTPYKCFKKGAILMAIRPLMIGAESRTNHFIQYEPSKGIFKELKDEVNAALENCTVYSVKPDGKVEDCDLSKVVAVPLPKPDEINHRGSSAQRNGSEDNKPYPYGIPVQCYNVPCIYEFRVFKYIGRHGKEK